MSGTIATIVKTNTIFVLWRFTSFANSPFYAGHVTGAYRARRSLTREVGPMFLHIHWMNVCHSPAKPEPTVNFSKLQKMEASINNLFSDIILHAWCFLCWSLRNCVVWFINELYEWVLDHINSIMSIYLQKNDDICEEANVYMSVSMCLWVVFFYT